MGEESVGKTLKMLREVSGLTSVEAAEKSGVTRQTISKIENGGECGLRTLAKVINGVGPGSDPNGMQAKLHSKLLGLLGISGSASNASNEYEAVGFGGSLHSSTGKNPGAIIADLASIVSLASELKSRDMQSVPTERLDQIFRDGHKILEAIQGAKLRRDADREAKLRRSGEAWKIP